MDETAQMEYTERKKTLQTKAEELQYQWVSNSQVACRRKEGKAEEWEMQRSR